ncbi:MAG: ferritin family protein [Desulfosudaceae bacterium]
MPKVFNPGEIFEMAVKMEQNGARFYKQASENVDDQEHRKLLLDLADMELEHEKMFQDMRQNLGADIDNYYDPDGTAVAYLKSIVDTEVFFKREIDLTTMETILREAIMAEKDSIVFYIGMKDLVPGEEGKQKIEDIIKEEMGHIRLLNDILTEI